MRYLLFAPLLPIAFLIYFSVRRFIPTADPEEIYAMLFVTVIGAIGPSAVIGLICRILEGRGIIQMPSWTLLYLVGWVCSALYVFGNFYADSRKGKRVSYPAFFGHNV